MEAQDTCMEARGPSYVNTEDTAVSQPRYSLRSTDKVNRRESSVTKVDPHHCAIAETEKQHSSPPQRRPDLTLMIPSMSGESSFRPASVWKDTISNTSCKSFQLTFLLPNLQFCRFLIVIAIICSCYGNWEAGTRRWQWLFWCHVNFIVWITDISCIEI